MDGLLDSSELKPHRSIVICLLRYLSKLIFLLLYLGLWESLNVLLALHLAEVVSVTLVSVVALVGLQSRVDSYLILDDF